MMFLLILVLATLVATAVVRIRSGAVRWRDSARHGLGIAFVVAGMSHFVDPTPFEQHLPDWMPAVKAVVAVSGIAEVLLGFALVAARRSAPVVGTAAAVFLVGVFPANVYVAVADVDVDGLPGGIYPWLRLPLQALFVAWAWVATRPAHDDAGTQPRRSFGFMPAVPPQHGPDRARTAAPTTVQASVLHLRRLRDVPGFMTAALRLRTAFADAPGAIEMSLRAAPLRRTFWTLSHWRSDADLRRFVAHPAHLDVMRRFGPAVRASQFVTWHATDDLALSWDDAARRMPDDCHPVAPDPVRQRA